MDYFKPSDLTEEKEVYTTQTGAENYSPEKRENADNEVIGGDLKEKPNENDSVFQDAAKVFGTTEEKLKTEFTDFKANKLFKKMSLTIDDSSIPSEILSAKIKSAIALSISGVAVLPDRLKFSLKEAAGRIPVYALISYPLAADEFKVKLCAVKLAAKTSAAGVEIPINLAELNEKSPGRVVKELKKLKKRAGAGKMFTLIAETGEMTTSFLTLLSEICREAGVDRLKTVLKAGSSKPFDAQIEEIKTIFGEKVMIVACMESAAVEDVVKAFSAGAGTFDSPSALKIVADFKRQLAIGNE